MPAAEGDPFDDPDGLVELTAPALDEVEFVDVADVVVIALEIVVVAFEVVVDVVPLSQTATPP